MEQLRTETESLPERTFYYSATVRKEEYRHWTKENRKQVQEWEANLISSRCENGLHAPVLDLDMPGNIVESEWFNGQMLRLQRQVGWLEYRGLLARMDKLGLIAPDYVDMVSNVRGVTVVRADFPFIVPVRLVESSSRGHHHLYIDHELDWSEFKKLLKSLNDTNLIEDGFYKASLHNNQSMVRLPHVKKE